jgi:hypothetical protein
VSPTRLNHADLRIGEKVDGSFKQVRLRDEVGIQNANEVAVRRDQSGFERARFETTSIRALDELNVKPAALQFRYA